MVPFGSPGVKDYRFDRPARFLGDVRRLSLAELYGSEEYRYEGAHAMYRMGEMVPEERLERVARWFGENGLEWDYLWTAHYGPDSLAVQDLLREQGVEIVAEIDDWFEDIPKGNPAFRAWWGQKREWMSEMLQRADRVAASTPALAEYYGGRYAPNFVDPAEWEYPARKGKNPEECVLLCNGGRGRAADYLGIEGPLRRFLEEPNTKVVFMHTFPEWALGYPPGKVVYCAWVPLEDYRRVVRWISPDVLVSPLEHNRFNEAKSNLKWLEAGMSAAMFVGERFGEYARTVEEGRTGILADGEQEWTDALIWAARNPDERRRVALRGCSEVSSKWTWSAVQDLWEKAVRGD